MSFNLFQKICGAFGKRGQAFYRSTIDAGKVAAPIAAPIVQGILTAHNLPVTGEGAITFLAAQAHERMTYPSSTIDEVAAFALAHLPPASPPPNGGS